MGRARYSASSRRAGSVERLGELGLLAPDPLQRGSAMSSSQNRISAVLQVKLIPIASYRSAANSVGV